MGASCKRINYSRKKRLGKESTQGVNPELQAPGWRIVEDEVTKVLKCKGRVPGYEPIYLDGGLFVEKLIAHTHSKIKHFGFANTMAALREQWWIPQL